MTSENCNDYDQYKESFEQLITDYDNFIVKVKEENNDFQKLFEKLIINYDNILKKAKEEYNELQDIKK